MTKSRRRNRRAETAIHEAGHAVIGRVLGMICGGASVVEDHDSAGHSITEDPWDIGDRWKRRGKFRDLHSVFVGRIMTFMAGSEAAELLAGTSCGQVMAMTAIKSSLCSKKLIF
jgi:hypothetical protein